ncbi:uncharacterized protein LOC108931622 isoform X2 [Scleropages formosus]|nr:uncharacterized protein LOC108931622 isoform X2 [Scleropages formosus]
MPPISTVIQQNKTFCNISFSPNIEQQATIATNGILGDFIVQYDVERDLGIGEIQVLNGHFVHYFAPKDLPVVPKNVVFVIDTSASMMGTKMRQTKEALFTILRDLRPNDHFNFVSFSSRMKVWQPDKLVPVTPNNIRDAKKFIYLLSPSGATNINLAIKTGSSLLSSHLSSEDLHHNSVSLLIFLTDGRPTVDEVRPSRILSNARSAVQEQFCVFTVGLGDDVDYHLLERLALENCGTMRRIPEEADASAMLKGFYDEIGTPLLSDIRFAYSEDAVEYVTEHLFSHYFNGSEIVIAGKLTNQSAESLHVQVTASNSNRSVLLESDVMLREREQETKQHMEAAGLGPLGDGYTERVFGFLSVKDSLKSVLRSQSSREREESTQQATNLSLSFNFFTPVTTMAVETPIVQVHEETSDRTTVPSAETPTQSPLSDATSLGNAVKKPTEKLIKISKTSADGDPHFVVEFPLSKLTMCFNINGEPGHILRLVSDHEYSGVTVNGMLIGAPAPSGAHKQQRTYFSTIAVVVDRPRHAYIEVTPHKVILDGTERLVLSSNTTVTKEIKGLSLTIMERSNVTITIQGTITFVILIHLYKNPAPFQRDHLGFYISNSKGLSENCHGLLGQFLYQEVSLTQMSENVSYPIKNTDPKAPTRTSPSEMPKNNTLGLPKSENVRRQSKIAQEIIPTRTAQLNSITITLQSELPKNTTHLELPTNFTQANVLTKTKQHDTITKTKQTVSKKAVQLIVPTKTSRFKRETRPTTGASNVTEHQRFENVTQAKVSKGIMQPKITEIFQSNIQKNIQNPNISRNITQPDIAMETSPSSVLTDTTQPIIQKWNTESDVPAKTMQSKILTKTMEQKVLTESTEPRILTKTTHPEIPNDRQVNILTNSTQPSLPKSVQFNVETKSKNIPKKSIQPDAQTKNTQLKILKKSVLPTVLKNDTQSDVPKTMKPSVPTKSMQPSDMTKITLPTYQKNNTWSDIPKENMQSKDLTQNIQTNVSKKTPALNILTKTTQPMVLKNNTQSEVPTKTMQPSIPTKSMQLNVPMKTTQFNILARTMQPTFLNNTQSNVPTKTMELNIPKNNMQSDVPARTIQPKDLTQNMQENGSKKISELNLLAKTTQPTVLKNKQPDVAKKTMQPKDLMQNMQTNVSQKTLQKLNILPKTVVLINTTQFNVSAKITKPTVLVKNTVSNAPKNSSVQAKTMQPMVLKNNTQPNVLKTTHPKFPKKSMQPSLEAKITQHSVLVTNTVQHSILNKNVQPLVHKNTESDIQTKSTQPSFPKKSAESSVQTKNKHPNVLINSVQVRILSNNTQTNVSTNNMQSTIANDILHPKVQRNATKSEVSTITVHPRVSRNTTEPEAQQNCETIQHMDPLNITRAKALLAPMENVQPESVEPNVTQYKVLMKSTQSDFLVNVSLPRVAIVPAITEHAVQPLLFPSLKIKGRIISVTQKTRKIYGGKEMVECWFVKNSATKLIDGQYEDYVVPHLSDTNDKPHGSNRA